MFKKSSELTLKEMINYEYYNKYLGSSISHYEIVYSQDTNNLIRFPGLTKMLNRSWVVKVNTFHNCLRLEVPSSSNTRPKFPMPFDEALKLIYNDFSSNKNIAIDFTCSTITLKTTPMYVDETFDEYRIRCNFQVRDYLGMSHSGHGNDSVKGNPRYNPGLFKSVNRVEQNQNADLFAGIKFDEN